MKIQLNLAQIPESWRDDQYQVIEDHWEDGEEWAEILIIDPKLKTWVSLTMPNDVIES